MSRRHTEPMKEFTMNGIPRVTFFHAPQSRSGGTRALFEELGVEPDLPVLNLKASEQRRPDSLAIHPMGKVPAIRTGAALITEQTAVFMSPAQLSPEDMPPPTLGIPLQGPSPPR